MKLKLSAALAVAGVMAAAVGFAVAADEPAPKFTIKQVMKTAHKDGLMKKLAGGQGSKEDAEQLLDLYKALGDNKPPKGEPGSWKEKTEVLVHAAQDVVDGKPDAPAALEKAANCAACHKAHKPG